VITLRTVKNMDSMSIEELIGSLKVHEKKLQQDEGFKKGKSLSLIAQKVEASSTCKESSSKATSKSSSKVVNIDTPSDDDSNN